MTGFSLADRLRETLSRRRIQRLGRIQRIQDIIRGKRNCHIRSSNAPSNLHLRALPGQQHGHAARRHHRILGSVFCQFGGLHQSEENRDFCGYSGVSIRYCFTEIALTEKKVLLRYKRFSSAIMAVLSVDEWVKVGLGPVETSGTGEEFLFG